MKLNWKKYIYIYSFNLVNIQYERDIMYIQYVNNTSVSCFNTRFFNTLTLVGIFLLYYLREVRGRSSYESEALWPIRYLNLSSLLLDFIFGWFYFCDLFDSKKFKIFGCKFKLSLEKLKDLNKANSKSNDAHRSAKSVQHRGVNVKEFLISQVYWWF